MKYLIVICIMVLSFASNSSTAQSDSTAFANASRVANELRADSTLWCDYVLKYSADIASHKTCGDYLGASRGMMILPIEKWCLSQNSRVVSEPVKTAYGYHVLLWLGKDEKTYGFRHILFQVK